MILYGNQEYFQFFIQKGLLNPIDPNEFGFFMKENPQFNSYIPFQYHMHSFQKYYHTYFLNFNKFEDICWSTADTWTLSIRFENTIQKSEIMEFSNIKCCYIIHCKSIHFKNGAFCMKFIIFIQRSFFKLNLEYIIHINHESNLLLSSNDSWIGYFSVVVKR